MEKIMLMDLIGPFLKYLNVPLAGEDNTLLWNNHRVVPEIVVHMQQVEMPCGKRRRKVSHENLKPNLCTMIGSSKKEMYEGLTPSKDLKTKKSTVNLYKTLLYNAFHPLSCQFPYCLCSFVLVYQRC